MTDQKRIKVFLFAAIAAFVTMAVLLQIFIHPIAGFLPQSSILGYEQSSFEKLGAGLTGHFATIYLVTLGVIDLFFVLCFSLWLIFYFRRHNAFYYAVLLLAGIYTTEIIENSRLLRELGVLGNGVVWNDAPPIVNFTRAKFAFFGVAILSAIWFWKRT